MRILLDHYYIACGVFFLGLIASSQLRRASSYRPLPFIRFRVRLGEEDITRDKRA
jgi:hypothetical protein